MKLIKHIMVGTIALGLLTTSSVALTANHSTVAQASSVTVPAKYRHTWYGKVYGHSVKYVIGKHYAYLYDGGETKPLKYKLVKSIDGRYGTVPVGGTFEATPFKPSGNHIIMYYDTQQVTLHR